VTVHTFLDFMRSDFQMMRRNGQALFWTFFFPVLLMGLMGVVFGQDNAFVAKLAIVNQDGSTGSQAMVAVFKKVPALKTSVVADRAQALHDLKNGSYAAVLVLPKDMTQQFQAGQVTLPFYYDDTSLVQAGQVNGVVAQVVQQMGYQITGTEPKLVLQAQGVSAKSFNYIDFLVPGIVAMTLMTSGIYAVSGTFVSYREKGVLRRLKATPMPLSSFVSARVLMQLLLALVQAGLVIAVGVFAFNVNIGGWSTLAPVAVLSLVGAASFVTIGFFIASISKNVESAAALGQVVGTPMMFLSGIFFPMDNAPVWIRPVVRAMPLAYLADAMREVMIQGQSLWYVRWDIVILLAVGTVFLGLSVRFFRWE
jgi:ABC-2 type transport system permease protein